LAERAITLDPDLADGYAARGQVMTRASAPTEPIAADFRRALELRPNSADVHQWYAQFLTREGKYDEALAETERAVSLDPLAPGVRMSLSLVGMAARRYEMVERGSVTLEPTLARGSAFLALGYLLSGDAQRCVMLGLGPYAGLRALCLHSLGKLPEAAKVVDSLRKEFTAGSAAAAIASPVINAQALAEYYAWTGNAEESLRWLEQAYSLSPLGENHQVLVSSLYDKVRDDPKFKAGFERIRRQVYQRVLRASSRGIRLN
jgi:tetratricopeptide (TPR) repeat protein